MDKLTPEIGIGSCLCHKAFKKTTRPQQEKAMELCIDAVTKDLEAGKSSKHQARRFSGGSARSSEAVKAALLDERGYAQISIGDLHTNTKTSSSLSLTNTTLQQDTDDGSFGFGLGIYDGSERTKVKGKVERSLGGGTVGSFKKAAVSKKQKPLASLPNSSGEVLNIWSRLARKRNVWSDKEDQSKDCSELDKRWYIWKQWNRTKFSFKHSIRICKSHPLMLGPPILIFSITLFPGLQIVKLLYDDNSQLPPSRWAYLIIILISIAIGHILLALLVERRTSEELRNSMIPKHISQKLVGKEEIVERFSSATILFADLVEVEGGNDVSPEQVIKILNSLYHEFDALVEKHGVHRINHVGSAYMVVGLTDRCSGCEAAESLALFALDVINCANKFRTTDHFSPVIRVGLASGTVVGGVVGGPSSPLYRLFGDTVQLAGLMELSCRKMKVQCSETTFRLLREAPTYLFHFEKRPEESVLLANNVLSFYINGAVKRSLITHEQSEQRRQAALLAVQFKSRKASIRRGLSPC